MNSWVYYLPSYPPQLHWRYVHVFKLVIYFIILHFNSQLVHYQGKRLSLVALSDNYKSYIVVVLLYSTCSRYSIALLRPFFAVTDLHLFGLIWINIKFINWNSSWKDLPFKYHEHAIYKISGCREEEWPTFRVITTHTLGIPSTVGSTLCDCFPWTEPEDVHRYITHAGLHRP